MNGNIFNLYRKLTDINAKNCCLCLSYNEENNCCIHDFVVLNPNFDNDETSDEEEIDIYFILQQVLGSKVAAYLSEYDLICKKCIQSAISSYKFIKMCRDNADSMAYSVEAFTTTLEYTEAMEKQDYKTMFIIMDLEESRCTQYYDTAQFADTNAALYKFQTLFRTYIKVIDNKGNTRYKCTKCESVFRYQHSAMKHFDVKHNGDAKISLKDEINSSMNDTDDDNNMCTDDINALSHEVLIDCDGVNKYRCKTCKVIYSSAQKARLHYKIKHSMKKHTTKTKIKKFIKPDCLAEFNYCKDKIERLNELSHTVLKDSSGAIKYKCKECNSIISNRYAARKHYLKYHFVETKFEKSSDTKKDDSETETKIKIINNDVYICVYCNEKYDSKYIFIEHLLKEHAAISSEFCNKSIDDINLLGNDIFNHIYIHAKEENGVPKYCCKMCLRIFKNYRNIRNHFNDTHIKPQVEDKEYMCIHCGKVFKTKQRLSKHEHRHEDSKVFCSTCNKEFKNKYYFKDHKCVQVERASKRGNADCDFEFICNECGRSLTTMKKLRSHMRSHAPKRFSCDYCPKLFSHRSQLKDHQVTHTRERNFSCHICGDVFVAKNALVYHTRIHTGERPYQCSHCDMRFLSASRRAHHIKRHHIAAKATCSICGITIKEVNMRRHMKRHNMLGFKETTNIGPLVSRKKKRQADDSESVSDCSTA